MHSQPVHGNLSHPLHARTIGFLADWISAYVFIKGNKERLVLYFLISFLGTFLSIFLVLSIRLYIQKRRAVRFLKETAPLASPISDITYEAHRDATLDPLDVSVPTTSQTTLNQGPHNGHRQVIPNLTAASGHTQTHLESQYQPLLSPSTRSNPHHTQQQHQQQHNQQQQSSQNNSPVNNPTATVNPIIMEEARYATVPPSHRRGGGKEGANFLTNSGTVIDSPRTINTSPRTFSRNHDILIGYS